jgi:hypothetical protein
MLKPGKEDKIFRTFKPTTKMQEAFQCIMNKFTKAPVLSHFDYNGLISVETVASILAIASVILQPAT